MEQIVTSEFKLGIISGGQLGKMIALAASNWDVKTYILDADKNCSSSTICTSFTQGNPLSYDDVISFGKQVDMITFEVENVNIEALKDLKKQGLRIFPDPHTLEIIQDKGLQKQFYQKHNIQSSSFQLFDDIQSIHTALQEQKISYPFVQKLRKGGYDGKGVAVIRSENDLNLLLEGPSLIEDCVNIKKELAVIAARNHSGEVKCFPIVEMEFNAQANLVDLLICPAQISETHAQRAVEIATKLVESFEFCGVLAIEFFLDQNDELWVNEVAPRPHNSGHHTIESVMTSQFEQLLRAIFNFPLGSTELKLPSAMINLLGEENFSGPVKYIGLKESMEIDGVKIHLYGKQETKPFRKMGHITILAKTLEEAKQKATLVKQQFKVQA